eukprot:jgi/Tetstr1/456502/TSEL_043225.t1
MVRRTVPLEKVRVLNSPSSLHVPRAALLLLIAGLLFLHIGTVESRTLHAAAETAYRSESDTSAAVEGHYMSCGAAPLCSVLVLETGLGDGAYRHSTPVLHGLWPQGGSFGSSSCIRPTQSVADLPYDSRRPDLLECYDHNLTDGMSRQENGFANHEWEKHGKCAGMLNVHDYLDDACGLAAAPLAVMAKARAAGMHDTYNLAEELYQAGYPVWKATYYELQEIHLSACAGSDHVWKLADPDEFSSLCGPGASPAAPAGAAVPSASAGQCVPGARGPACSGNSDCSGVGGCVRCAKTGYCTNIP